MIKKNEDVPISADSVTAKTTTIYPKPYDSVVKGRSKKVLGDLFGLANFGVNQTTLAPGASSALQHSHSKQDEFIYILSGSVVLKLGSREHVMTEGDCMGFPAGDMSQPHCIVNRSSTPSVVLEVGDRTKGDVVTYPEADLQAIDRNGKWELSHKDGTPYS